MSFDIDSLDVAALCEAGHEFELVNPLTQEPLGAFITVRGLEAPAIVQHLQARGRADAQRAALARRRGQEPPALTPDEAEQRGVDLAVLATRGWRGLKRGGVELQFSEATARALYRERAWIAGQVLDEARDLGNFAPRPSVNSSSSAATSSS